ncbi:hypothetical protein [Paraburkholderia piptadeniae]|uniref:hypothetical protein n=1 Tax=Paraburkholderia piptadeniae TaxID=1701573 RepID=UPI00117E30BB|nr:hypothetical protein [Paraburkholderia piptadeniae]
MFAGLDARTTGPASAVTMYRKKAICTRRESARVLTVSPVIMKKKTNKKNRFAANADEAACTPVQAKALTA